MVLLLCVLIAVRTSSCSGPNLVTLERTVDSAFFVLYYYYSMIQQYMRSDQYSSDLSSVLPLLLDDVQILAYTRKTKNNQLTIIKIEVPLQ